MKAHVIAFFLLFIFSGIGFSQEKYSFQKGQVTQHEISMTEYENDKEAEALVIYDEGVNRLQGDDDDGRFLLHKNRIIKIKILKEAGLSYANFEIPLYEENRKPELLEIVSGTVYNTENGSLVKTEFDGKTYSEKISNNWIQKKFTLPNVKIGSIIELEYRISTPYLFNMGEWNFQRKIPVIYSKLNYRAIPYYEYTFIMKGTNKFDEFTTNEQNRDIRWRSLEYREVEYTLGMKNVPAFKDEEFISSSKDYMISINFQLSQINYPDGRVEQVMSTWPQMCEDFLKMSEFGKYVKDSEKEAKKILSNLELSGLTQEEQLKKITQYIKSTYNWNERNGKFAEKKLSDFLKDKTGNAANLNLFLIGLLNASKIDAVPVVLSTRENGNISLLHPFESFFNYVIAMVNINGKNYFIDATEPLLYYNELPKRCMNRDGLVIKSKKEEWVKIYQKEPAVLEKEFNIAVLPEENKLKVDLAYTCSGYEAYYYRSIFEGEEGNLSDYLKEKKNIDVEGEITVKNESLDQPFFFSFSSTVNCEENSGKLFIQPFCGQALSSNPFKQNKRNLPVDLIYLYKEKYNSTITIPEGYKVEFIPENRKLDNQQMALNYTVKKTEDGKINIEAEYQFKETIYNETEYNALKSSITTIVDKLSEMIILVKE